MKIPETPPTFDELFADDPNPTSIFRIVSQVGPVDGKGCYLHWDDLRNRTPPEGLTHRQWWLGTMFARRAATKELPLQAIDGRPLHFSNIDLIQEMVHRIDQKASGQILTEDVVTSLRSSDRYLVSSLQEEAITSSQLEGASTTRRVAKEMLATGRKPRDRSEQMIANNFQAMLFAQELASHPLESFGRRSYLTYTEFRSRRARWTIPTVPVGSRRPTTIELPSIGTTTLFCTGRPWQVELPGRLEELCRFANGDSSTGFVHPVVRAIVIHYCLAYDHPFEDGNGRTARALFYWSMLHDDYWLAQYLSISSILHKAPVQYARSYLLSETDDNDITYFIVYQLEVLERAVKALHSYLMRKIAETKDIERLIHGSSLLNQRQILVVRDALRDPAEPFTINAQARRNRVTYQTARTDLLDLGRLGLFTRHTVGKKFVFHPVPDLMDRLRALGQD